MIFGRKPSWSSRAFQVGEEGRAALAGARDEAIRMRHDYVGTEHLLLAVASTPEGGAAAVLAALAVDPVEVRRRVEEVVQRGRASGTPDALPYTSRAKRVLEFAMAEAHEMKHRVIGPEHLLLGLIREEKGVGSEVLRSLGATLEAARAEAARLGSAAPGPAGRGGAEAGPALEVRIDDASPLSIYEQVVSQVREAVATRRIGPGDRLPTVRRLADRLDVAPGTVARAYGELERLGVVVTEGARGTRVAPREEPSLPEGARPETLAGLLRPVAVAAFHLGASARELRGALEEAMRGIFAEEPKPEPGEEAGGAG
ncbi:MAG TPA: Clp protease N-terminal domain-containing protein [Longimicrobiaceae bacterium]